MGKYNPDPRYARFLPKNLKRIALPSLRPLHHILM